MNDPWSDTSVAANGRLVKDNFSDWFGKSQVVDVHGRPLVVYHATVSSFDEFCLERFIHFERDAGKAFFYGDAAAASDYALAMSDSVPGHANLVPVYLSIQKPYVVEVDGFPSEAWDMAGGRFEREAPWGTDGYIVRGINYDDEPETMYVACHAWQIKSALGNSGLYLKDSPSITDCQARRDLELAAIARMGIQARKANVAP